MEDLHKSLHKKSGLVWEKGRLRRGEVGGNLIGIAL